MTKKILLFLIGFSINIASAQKIFENKQYGFSIEEPHNWVIATNDEVVKNLKKEVEDNLSEFLKSNKASISVVNFYKYKTNEHPGLIPTIKVLLCQNPSKYPTDFKAMISRSSKSFEKIFPDFEYIKAPSEILISNIKSVYFIAKYSMKTRNGIIKVRSRTYAVPYGKFFYQINFIDGQLEDDCSAEFDELVKTIKIEKTK